jgi:serine phosphatase RsbU (regulator of sigma subunit)
MRLRYQLIAAFLLLAVLPLSAVTIYSYRASIRAFRQAVEAESSRMAEEMENRMAAVAADLGRKIEALQGVPAPETPGSTPAGGRTPSADYIGKLLGSLGEAAVYLDTLQLETDEGADPTQAPPAPPAPQAAVVVELPKLLEALGREIAASSRADGEGEPVVRAEEIQALADQVAAQIDGNARAMAQAWKIQVRPAAAVAARPGLRLDFNREFRFDVRRGDRQVGRLRATVGPERLMEDVVSRTAIGEGEIPFAVDSKGNLYTPDEADLPKLRSIPLLAAGPRGEASSSDEDWVVVTREDATTGIVLGLAHPVGESLEKIRTTSVRNLVLGLGMAFLALLGVLPLSHRITRNLTEVTRGANRLASGDLGARVPIRTRDEVGQLARTFNQMAEHLEENQRKLVEQERLRKELEMCRQIQSELLPRVPLRSPFAQVQGVSIPARELGGDFFNYFELSNGEIALLMGDVSGKGVPAALLMANLQATLRARLPVERDLASFAASLDREVEASTAAQVYLTLFVSVLDLPRRELRFVNAGHQVPFLTRKDGQIELLEPTGRPIGLLSGGSYQEGVVPISTGDGLFLHTDGLVDSENASGEAFGMDRLARVLAGAPGATPEALLARVEEAVRLHRGAVEAPDDAAMLFLRIGDLA